MKHYQSKAFTMIEVLIVVVIIGILASVVMAMVSVNQDESRRVSAAVTAQRVQEAVELYRHQTGRLPDLLTDWTPLTGRATVNGITIGPLLQTVPRNPAAAGDQSLVADSATEMDATACAFAYDYQDGQGSGRFTAAKKKIAP